MARPTSLLNAKNPEKHIDEHQNVTYSLYFNAFFSFFIIGSFSTENTKFLKKEVNKLRSTEKSDNQKLIAFRSYLTFERYAIRVIG